MTYIFEKVYEIGIWYTFFFLKGPKSIKKDNVDKVNFTFSGKIKKLKLYEFEKSVRKYKTQLVYFLLLRIQTFIAMQLCFITL